MKKVIGLLGLLILLLAVANPGMAQMTEWKWDAYKTKFKAPSDIKVDKKDGTEWSGGNGKVYLTIYPSKGENLTYDKMDEKLRLWASTSSLSGYDDVQLSEDLNGYWGVYVDAVADNGNPTFLLLAVDPDYPEIALYVMLQYQSGNEALAYEIVKSFTPN
jgi:Dihydro-orotase-like